LTYVEQGSGFVLSDINYPLNGSIDEKKKFFNKNLACKRKILRKKIMTGIMIYMRIEFLKIFN
jgi:hypothetical protein